MLADWFLNQWEWAGEGKLARATLGHHGTKELHVAAGSCSTKVLVGQAWNRMEGDANGEGKGNTGPVEWRGAGSERHFTTVNS